MRGWPALPLLVALVFVLAAAPVSAAENQTTISIPDVDAELARGSPEISVRADQNQLSSGTSDQVVLRVVNEGDVEKGGLSSLERRVTTARDVKIRVRDDAPIDFSTNEKTVGVVPAGSQVPVPLDVTVSPDADPGPHTVDVEVSYTYTNVARLEGVSVTYGESRRTVTKSVEFSVTEDARFRLMEVTHDVPVGGTGTLELEVKNTGSRKVSDATVSVGMESGTIGRTNENTVPSRGGGSLGSASSLEELRGVTGSGVPSSGSGGSGGTASLDAESYVGGWSPGETKSVRFRVNLPDDAVVRNYSVGVHVGYADPGGRRTTGRLVTGFRPTPPPELEFRGVESDLRVGGYGELTGEVVNTGPTRVRDAVLVLESRGDWFTARRNRYPVGTLQPGESGNFSFPITVNGEASGGPRRFSFSVRHRRNDETLSEGGLSLVAEVGEPGRVFSVESVNASLARNSRGTVVVQVTNTGDHIVTEVIPRYVSNGPVSTYSEEGFIRELAPGETRKMRVGVDAGGAAEKVYPVAVDFRYRNAWGDTRLSDRHYFSVAVEEAGSMNGVVNGLAGVFLLALFGSVLFGALLVKRDGLRGFGEQYRERVGGSDGSERLEELSDEWLER